MKLKENKETTLSPTHFLQYADRHFFPDNRNKIITKSEIQ